jgi:hypothetical protein
LKSLLLLVALFVLHSTSFAHQYYFGFAEVEYDFFSQRFEATLTVSAHDFELALTKNGTPAGDLEALDSVQSVIVEDYINACFKINSNGSKCDFTLIGHDTELNGKINFYLESSEIAIEGIIDVEFDILMDNYQEQQNKITLYYLEQIYTLAFTRGNKKQTVQIVNLQE